MQEHRLSCAACKPSAALCILPASQGCKALQAGSVLWDGASGSSLTRRSTASRIQMHCPFLELKADLQGKPGWQAGSHLVLIVAEEHAVQHETKGCKRLCS